MALTWLLHAVGFADLGVPAGAPGQAELLAGRIAAVRAASDRADLVRMLAELDWDPPVSGVVSPLAAVAATLPATLPDLRLVLFCTAVTRPVGEVLREALCRVPDLMGRPFDQVSVARSDDGDMFAGMTENSVVTATAPHLAAAHDPDDPARVLVVWGSGSTQIALGLTDAATVAGVPWTLIGIDNTSTAARPITFEPARESGIDPIVPLLRRWHYHDRLAALVAREPHGLTERQRAALAAEAERWRAAHERPTAESLRLVVAASLARGDASSGFSVRRYVLAHYHELRRRDPNQPLDLVYWVERSRGTGPVGDLIQTLHDPRRAWRRRPVGATLAEIRASLASPSGQWLLSPEAKALNDIGIRASHELKPPRPGALRAVRDHLNGLAPPAQPTGMPWIGPTPATTAWYIRVTGTLADARSDLLATVATSGADTPVANYLGLPTQDVGLRFLVLGTRSGSAANATSNVTELNNLLGDQLAVADVVPDPGEPFTDADAEALLRRHFAPISGEIGAVVLVPTGHKGVLLPLITAAHRLATDHGIPLFLRQLNASGRMHRLPLRFGADRDLLELAADALSTVEFDVAARLLDGCGDTQDLADRTRALATAVHCRHTGGTLPELAHLTPADRHTSLIPQRLAIWAGLAAEHPTPAQIVRAIFGACAAVEGSIRSSSPDRATRAVSAHWQSHRTRLQTGRTPHAVVLDTLFQVRNRLPTSHGTQPLHPGDLDRLVHATFQARTGHRDPTAPTTVAELLALAITAAQHWPHFHVRPLPGPTLSSLHADLRAAVTTRLATEKARLARQHVAAGQIPPGCPSEDNGP